MLKKWLTVGAVVVALIGGSGGVVFATPEPYHRRLPQSSLG